MVSESAVGRIDRSGMARHVADLPDQLQEGFALGRDLGPVAAGRRTAVVGMGGSAIAGEVLGAWLARERGAVLRVVRDFELPPGVGAEDLVVVVSYSGNTMETLAAAREAKDRGCEIVGIASGGKLRRLCASRHYPFVRVPGGLAPRAAFGYVFGALAGLYEGMEAEVRTAATAVGRRGRSLAPSVAAARNPAKKLARRVRGRTPIVYATPTYAPVARRWQTQFNENAKVLSWASALPEADHNELVGWAEDLASRRFAPIFLWDAEESSPHAAVLKATRDLLRGRARAERVRGTGPTLLARMLTTLHVGDWTSLYLAVLRKVDPTPVAVIGRLKSRLAR